MKTILITGATDGIGLETAKLFAKEGHHLLLHGRSEKKLENVKEEILSLNNEAIVELFQADFSILKDVYRMADHLLKNNKKIDVLINNAGIFTVEASQRITKDNLDIRFQVNTIAPYILTKKLLPLLQNKEMSSRVINLSSAAQAPVDYNALQNKEMLMPLSADEAYAQSKLALNMWTIELAQAWNNNPMLVAVNPKSFLGSKMVKEAYGQNGYDLKFGADILHRAALSDEFKTANGMYFDNDYGMFSNPHPFALDKENRKKVMQILDLFLE